MNEERTIQIVESLERTFSQNPPFISATYQGFCVHLDAPEDEKRMIEVVLHEEGLIEVTHFDTVASGTRDMDHAIIARRRDVGSWSVAASLVEEWSGIRFEASADGRPLHAFVICDSLKLEDKASRRLVLCVRFRAAGGMKVSVRDDDASIRGMVGFPAVDWFEVEDAMQAAGISFRPVVAADYPRQAHPAP